MKLQLLVVCVSVALAFFSCNYPCSDLDTIDFNFIGYDSAEVDSVILKKYKKGSNFNAEVDTAFFVEKNEYWIKQANDTIYFAAKSGSFSIDPHHDWIVFLPALSKSIHITEITLGQEYSSHNGCNKVGCLNPVQSITIDGRLEHPMDWVVYFRR